MKIIKQILGSITLMILATTLLADIPDGYYDSADGLSGDQLKSTLNNIIDNHTELSYSGVWNALKDTDEDPNNSNNVILLYTGWSVSDSGYPTWNREHTWAKSHGDFGNNAPCGTDVHHLRPTNPDVNSARGNKDFDNGGNQHSIATGCYYDSDSWEPRDEVKGDVARMIFYMATRYEGEGGEPDLVVVDEVNTSPSPEHGKLSTLLQWNLQDPPDEFEMNRNDKIYENWQGNRNPFVDHPEFASYIWGGDTPDLMANFTVNVSSGAAPLTVLFTDQSAGEIVNWEWDFDNNGTIDSNDQNPSYTYNSVGTYSVKLVITTADNETAEKIQTDMIEVIVPGTEPIVILAESFENGASDWQIVSDSSDEDWYFDNDISGYVHPESVPDGNYYAYINNYNANSYADDWLISPAVDLSDYVNCHLSFDTWTNFSDDITGLKVYLSNDNENWDEINPLLSSTASQNWVYSGEIDLADYQQNVYVAFRHQSTGTSSSETTAWAIDDIQIIGSNPSSVEPNILYPDYNLKIYPNPLSMGRNNSSTTISYNLPEQYESAEIEIFNLKGQSVRNFHISQNSTHIVWNGTDRNNKKVSSSIYLIKLIIDKESINLSKCIIMK